MQEKNQLTISFGPDGTVQHTLNDAFMQPDFDVPRTVERMTDIKHETAINCFYIVGLLDPVKGKYFDKAMINNLNVDISDIPHRLDRRGVLLFGGYEEAVRVEIRVIDALRVQGVTVGSTADHTSEIELSPAEYTVSE